jgi:hypothetical protein
MAQDEDRPHKESAGGREEPTYASLAMNPIAAGATQESSEVGSRAGRSWLLLVGVLLVAAFFFWLARLATDMTPGEEAEARLAAKLSALQQDGTLQSVTYLSGSKVRIDLSMQISTADEAGRERLRQATIQVMKVLMEERPDRDLQIVGYQGQEQIVRARYRHKERLVSAKGEWAPDISVRVKGDSEGLGEAASQDLSAGREPR